jgi:hypothetical protein
MSKGIIKQEVLPLSIDGLLELLSKLRSHLETALEKKVTTLEDDQSVDSKAITEILEIINRLKNSHSFIEELWSGIEITNRYLDRNSKLRNELKVLRFFGNNIETNKLRKKVITQVTNHRTLIITNAMQKIDEIREYHSPSL